MTYCMECGREFRKATKFCTNCGTLNQSFQRKTFEGLSKNTEEEGPQEGETTEELDETEDEEQTKGSFFGALLFVVSGLALILLVVTIAASLNSPNFSGTLTPAPTLSGSPEETDFSSYSDEKLCEQFPKKAKRLGKVCDSETVVAVEELKEMSSPKPTKVTVRAGYQAMVEALDQLNESDPEGYWVQDIFESSSPLIAGVLLDNYSDYPEGCAAWFFDTEADSEKAMDNGFVNMFSDFYGWWIYESGPALIVVANSETDACYQNITEIMELSD